MLTIRKDQARELGRSALQTVEGRIFELARSTLAPYVAALSDRELRTRIHEEVDVALGFGIRGSQAHLQFVGLALMGGASPFYATPIVAQQLHDAGPGVEALLDRILDGVIACALAAEQAPGGE